MVLVDAWEVRARRCLVGVAAARPRHDAWAHLRAAPFVAFDTSIGCALHVECHGGVG